MKTIYILLLGMFCMNCEPDDEYKTLLNDSASINFSVDNISALKKVKIFSDSLLIDVLGYYQPNDDGGGTFFWDANSREPENGGTIIEGAYNKEGRWKRKYNNKIKVSWFGAKGDGVTNDTEAIEKAINTFAKTIELSPNKSYLISSNILKLNSSQNLQGNGANIICYDNNTAKFGKNSYFIQLTENNSIHEVIFKGRENSLYALLGNSSSFTGKCKNIIVDSCDAFECGLILINPEGGFTYNRINDGDGNWYKYGPVSTDHISENIFVSNCRAYGFKGINTLKNNFASTVSAFAFLYSKNVTVSNSFASNYRFGIWSYGGSNYNSNIDGPNNSPLWNNNITSIGNNIQNTYSGLFYSKTKNSIVKNNFFKDWVDTTLDFEASSDCLAQANYLVNDRGGLGLTALSDCTNITFLKNYISFSPKIQRPVVYVRDASKNIIYRGNTFICDQSNGSFKGKLKVSGEKYGYCDGILIEENQFINFDIHMLKKTDNIIIKNNKFHYTGANSYLNSIVLVDNNQRYILNNVFSSSQKSEFTNNVSPQISILQGASTTSNRITSIKNNTIYNSNDNSGLFTFISLLDNPEASLIIENNLVNAIYIHESMIQQVKNNLNSNITIRGNFIENSSSKARIPASLRKTNGSIITNN